MTPERWQQLKQIFQSALERNPAERSAFLSQACADDPALRNQVESLIASHDQAGDSIEAMAAEAATEMLANDPAGPIVGKQIGHYRVLSRIGRGGMGEVFLAQDTSLGRKVALKLLRSDFTRIEERLRRFRQEARAASALNHPNILTIYEIGHDGSLHFMATEYVEGETLRQHLSRTRITVSQTLDVGVQVSSALAAAHQAGIIHRDIKPENIMLRTDGNVKVLDFGLAKLTDPKTIESAAPTLPQVETAPGVVMGTFSYMSPEQARGLAVDTRTDIWSLGVMIYEMAAGRQPFEGETASDVMSLILQKEPLPLAHSSPEVPAELERIVRKALRKDKEERYQTIKDLLIDLRNLRKELELSAEMERSAPPMTGSVMSSGQSAPTTALSASSAEYIVTEIKQHKRAAVGALAVILIASAAYFFYFHRTKASALTEKDTILLADFVNTTGDAVFDGALKQALAVQLEQSPFLNIFPDERVQETLRLMNRPPETRVTRDVAREICERQGLKAMLVGSIAPLGSHYVIALDAVNARTGDVLDREQTEAESKEQVLSVLGKTATHLREKLGESLSSIQKFDTPIEQATTSSLEALKAFTLGNEKLFAGSYSEAIPPFERAVALDPNFALAYSKLAITHYDTGQVSSAAEFATKAFGLRERASEREKFYISNRYYDLATGELDKSIDVLELWERSYPRDVNARINLAFAYMVTGQAEKAIPEAREAMRLNANAAQPYNLLGAALVVLGQLDEGKAVYQEAIAKKLDSWPIRYDLYGLAFIQGDQALMQQQLDWAAGTPFEGPIMYKEADTLAFSGQLRKSQELFRRATSINEQRLGKDAAAYPAAEYALWVAMFGDCQQAKKEAATTLSFAHGNEEALWRIAVAAGLCGESIEAQSIADELVKGKPKGTIVNAIFLPTIRGAVETNRNKPAQAIQLLQTASRFERYYPFSIYVRGLAYLSQRSGAEAALEFQKIIGQRSNADNPLYPLAYLGLARAAALTGDRSKSREAYDHFFELWKNADSNIPIQQEARREYEKLG
jgi:serine/threonine protein kinase/tetratricopeptide (TPR) repeat protein